MEYCDCFFRGMEEAILLRSNTNIKNLFVQYTVDFDILPRSNQNSLQTVRFLLPNWEKFKTNKFAGLFKET